MDGLEHVYLLIGGAALGLYAYANDWFSAPRPMDRYEAFGEAPRYMFTYFFLPTCGYCKKAFPEWYRFEQSYHGNVALRKVDVSADRSEANSLGLQGYPSFVLQDLVTGQTSMYQGERTADAWNHFLATQAN